MAFPHLKTVLVERVFVEGGPVHVTARSRDDLVVDCPGCGTAAHRVHSRYQRHLADTAVAGRPVVIDLSVRRLVCDRPTCPRRTFVEQVEGLTVRYGRRTPSLHRLLVAIALALAQGRPGQLPVLDALPPTLIVQRVLNRHVEINRMVNIGYPVSETARRLGLDRKTVRHYRDIDPDTLLASARDRRSVPLDRFKPFLQAEFAAGRTSGNELFQRLREQAYQAVERRCGNVLGKRRLEELVVAAAVDVDDFYRTVIPVPCSRWWSRWTARAWSCARRHCARPPAGPP
ncbi:zinc-finger of transposase IS204/IS1001/IS1096/IS1165 [Streptomyces sp. OV198]|jgi:hypothetical protein|nr:zinc-finger of transposase IS204/IS1001/IS1096/IS1165 [Streptomyces sp. OV198]